MQNCHYSCKKCLQAFYDRCIQCHQGYNYQELINTFVRQGQRLSSLKYGLCQGSLNILINPLGIIAFILCIVTYWLKMYQKKHSNIILLISWIQTLSMLSFISVPFQQPLSYLLQSFTPFMMATTLSKLYKLNEETDSFILDHQYRLKHYLMSEKAEKNMFILGPIICILIVYIGLIPLFLHFRKRICGEDKCRRWSERILKKIQGLFYILFFFIIQQTYLILFLSLKMDPSKLAIILTILFILATIFMIINYAMKPITQFPNKRILFLHIFEKITLALVVISPANVYLVVVPSISFILRLIEAKMNDKNYNLNPNEKKMYFGYLICVTVVLFLIGAFLVVEKTAQSQMASKALAILASFAIVTLYGSSLGVQGFEIWRDYRKKQQQQINARNGLIRQQVTTLTLTTQMNELQQQKNQINDIKIQIIDQQRQCHPEQPQKYRPSNTNYREDLIQENSTKRLRKQHLTKDQINSIQPALLPQISFSQKQSTKQQHLTSRQNQFFSPTNQYPTCPKNQYQQQTKGEVTQNASLQINLKDTIRNEFIQSPSSQKLKKRKRKTKRIPVLDDQEFYQTKIEALQQKEMKSNKYQDEQNRLENDENTKELKTESKGNGLSVKQLD